MLKKMYKQSDTWKTYFIRENNKIVVSMAEYHFGHIHTLEAEFHRPVYVYLFNFSEVGIMKMNVCN